MSDRERTTCRKVGAKSESPVVGCESRGSHVSAASSVLPDNFCCTFFRLILYGQGNTSACSGYRAFPVKTWASSNRYPRSSQIFVSYKGNIVPEEKINSKVKFNFWVPGEI